MTLDDLEPIDFDCPACGAKPGEVCKWPNDAPFTAAVGFVETGLEAVRGDHPERIKVWEGATA